MKILPFRMRWSTVHVSHFATMAPVLGLAIVGGALVSGGLQPKELSAGTSSRLGPDYDQDGLADAQEFVLGTLPDRADSDDDSFHDIEEVARGSDPMDPGSMPLPASLAVGMYTYAANGNLNLHTAVYVQGGDLSDLSYQFGMFLRNQPVTIAGSVYSKSTKSFLYSSPQNPADGILVLEMPIPASLVTRFGQLSLYSKVMKGGIAPVEDADITNLIASGGEIARIEPAPLSVQGGIGVIYRPLIPGGGSGSSSGQVCWQQTTPVGSNGSVIVYEIDQAACQELDSYCSPTDCANSVGKTLELPDPGALVGG